MAKDKWTGTGTWTSTSNWSTGAVPGSTTAAEIESGTVTLTSAGSAASIVIDPVATFDFVNGASLTTTAWLKNSGALNITGNGDTVTIGGALDNSGSTTIGTTTLGTSTTVTASGFSNNSSGVLTLQGNATSGTNHSAVFDVTTAVASILTGEVKVYGDADLQLVLHNGITQVGSGALLLVDGAQARISSGTGTHTQSNSALQALALNNGTVIFNGNDGSGAGGTSITTTTGFNNVGLVDVDSGSGDGASVVSIGGTLTNSGTVVIGNTSLGTNTTTASTNVTVTSLSNSGSIFLLGNVASGTTSAAVLDVTGSSPTTVTGYIHLEGDANLILSSGVTSTSFGSYLEIDGSKGGLSLTSSGTINSALSGLSVIDGTLSLQGNTALGAGGTSLTTTVALVNAGTILVDTTGSGSSITVGGTLTNYGTFTIGNAGMPGSTSVTLSSLISSGFLDLQGNGNAGTTDQVTLDVTGTGPTTVTGTLYVLGDADLQVSSSIAAVGYGASLTVEGSEARVSIGAGTTNSGLSGFSINDGTAAFESNVSDAGVVTVTTSAGFTNNGTLTIDKQGGGGSSINFGGMLNNQGVITIGNTNLSSGSGAVTTSLTAAGLSNIGSINVLGNVALGSNNDAVLDVASGPTPAVLSGHVLIQGYANLDLDGAITSISATSYLELDGGQAFVTLDDGRDDSALTGLSNNAGTLIITGNDGGGGAGALSLTMTSSLINAGTIDIDNLNAYNGGTNLTIDGVLTNYGSINIGINSLVGTTAITTGGLVNSGYLAIQGNSTAGTTGQVTFDAGSNSATIAGAVRIFGDTDLQLATGITTVSYNGTIQVDGSEARISLGTLSSTTSTALTGLTLNDGLTNFDGYCTAGAGGTTITTLSSNFTNNGTLWIDKFIGDGASSVSFGGTLYNQGTTLIGNLSLAQSVVGASATTTVTAEGLVNSGTLTLIGNINSGTTDEAILTITGTGSSPTVISGQVQVDGDADLQVNAAITSVAAYSSLEIDGSEARISIGNGTTNSALSQFSLNEGTFTLQGNAFGAGAGGTSLTTSANLTNAGTFMVDTDGGGSSVDIVGTLTNYGQLLVGNGNLDASTTFTVTSLTNGGTLTLQGNDTSGTADALTFDITGVLSPAVTGQLRVSGYADLEGTHSITSVAAGSSLEVDGSQATLGTSNSDLSAFAANLGTLSLEGDTGLGLVPGP